MKKSKLIDDSFGSILNFITNSKKQSFEKISDNFTTLTKSIDITSMVKVLLQAYVIEPHTNIYSLSINELLLHEDETYTLALKKFKCDPAESNITTLPSDAMFGNLSNSYFEICKYQLPEENELRSGLGIDRTKSKSEKISTRDTFSIKAGKESFKVIGAEPVFVLCLFDKKVNDIGYSFCGRSGSLITPIANDLESSRIAYNLELLRNFASLKDSVLIANLALEHKAHFVRWEAIKTLAHFDYPNLKELLVRLSNDPHPHIRKASLATLENLEVSI